MSKKPRPNPVRQDGPLVTHGMMWVNEDAHGWKRFLLRRYERAGRYEFSELTHLDPDFAFCLRCLSHEVVVSLRTPDAVGYDCDACGLQALVVDMEVEPRRLLPPPPLPPLPDPTVDEEPGGEGPYPYFGD